MEKTYNYFVSILRNHINGSVQLSEEDFDKEELKVLKSHIDYKITVDKIRKKVEFSVFLKAYPNVVKSEIIDLADLFKNEDLAEIKADLNGFLEQQAILWVKDITRFKLVENNNKKFFL